MAHYTGTFTTGNQWIIDFAQVLQDNGWTIDYNGAYQTTNRRLHFHSGGFHVDLYNSGLNLYYYGCTGYDAGKTPDQQPGASISKNAVGVANTPYHIFALPQSVYFGLSVNTNPLNGFYWGGFCFIVNKIGNWADGFYIQSAASGCSLFNGAAYGSPSYAQLFYNGAWSPMAVAGGVYCNGGQPEICMKQPMFYNGGILPIPFVIFIGNLADSSKRHPLGYAPNIYRVSVGDIYQLGETLTINGDDYMVMPWAGASVGGGSYADCLFKLNA